MQAQNKLLLKTIYGNYTVEQPLVELINAPAIQRLKKISQRGCLQYAIPSYADFSRYDHSIGVLALLIHYNAKLSEQIAGLLHDASHTVFSHVADTLFEHKSVTSSYQDDIHEWYLKKQKIDPILKKYNFSLKEILHKSGNHKILEDDLPEICADRLEYNLRVALYEKLINQNDIDQVLANLKFENKKWFFIDQEIAEKFARLPLYLTETAWASATNILVYQWTAQALKRALEIKLITKDDIHFSTDLIVWKKLITSKDEGISNSLNKATNSKQSFTISTPENYDQIVRGKFRAINPLVKVKDNLVRLTVLSPEFTKEYERVKNIISRGWYVKT